jgi:hypothetical protein
MTEAAERWYSPQVNKHHVWQGYVDSYDNQAFGILQEDCQNSFDAYSPDVAPKDMKVVIKYDADARVLRHRDFGTQGMPHCVSCNWGIGEGDIECTNPSCPWGSFHNMGYSTKAGEALGSRGMGKSLQLLSGKRTTVVTTLPGGETQASLWERTGKDWQWRIAPDAARTLSAPGTEITTTDIIDRVHDQLLDSRAVISELQNRWFRLVEQGAAIEFMLVRGGKSELHHIRVPASPELDETQGKDHAHRTIAKVVVKYGGRRVGEFRNFNLFIAKRSIPTEDGRWGIAVVKNGKQTITQYTDFPDEVPESIRRRLFGYADAVCTKDEPFLQEAENAQHTGYQWSNPIWKAARRQLKEIMLQFVQPFLRAGGEKVTEKEQEEAKEILVVFNQALKDVPEWGLFGKEGLSSGRKVVIIPKTVPYLSRVEFEDKSYARGEKARVKAILKNPTAATVPVRVNFEHFDPTPIVVEDLRRDVLVSPGTPETPGTQEADCELTFDPDQAPGVHWVQVSLLRPDGGPYLDAEGEPIRSRRRIFCEFELPTLKRGPRSGTGDPKVDPGKGGGEGTSGLSGIQWYKKPELRDSYEGYIDTSQGLAFVNFNGRRLEFAVQNATKKRAYWPVVGEVIAEKLLELKAALDAGSKENWSAEEVKNKLAELESSKAKLVRGMVKILEAG